MAGVHARFEETLSSCSCRENRRQARQFLVGPDLPGEDFLLGPPFILGKLYPVMVICQALNAEYRETN